MAEQLVARASVVVAAPRAAVWATLLAPETVKRIMPVVDVIAGWRAGERFEWTVDMLGKHHRVDGVVHRLEPERLLEYDYVDPHSRDILRVENTHRVTIELADGAAGTRVGVVQDGNLTKAALAHAEGGWRLALHNLKALVE